jgi:spore coat polysaccharide biosynthesis protein SpsF
MRVVATVQSRMGSQRLPGKNMLPILGRPMVARLIERLRRARRVDDVCLATTTEPADDVLVELAADEGVAWYRGSVDDVLDRVLGAAKSRRADVVVEITGDCPLVDPAIADAAIERYLRGDVDYAANVLDRLTFPQGFDVQVYATALLEEISRLTDDFHDRNNVTPFIYRHPDRYRVLNLCAPRELDRPGYRLLVDYPEDLEVVEEVYSALYPRDPEFDAFDIVRFLDVRPELVARNTAREDAFEFPRAGGPIRHEVLELDA